MRPAWQPETAAGVQARPSSCNLGQWTPSLTADNQTKALIRRHAVYSAHIRRETLDEIARRASSGDTGVSRSRLAAGDIPSRL